VGGAVGGGLIGFGQLLGLHQSALAVVLENTDRDAVVAAMKGFGAEAMYAELQGETLVKLEELTEDDEVTAEAEEAFESINAE
jgi:uncharacterized membrane protein